MAELKGLQFTKPNNLTMSLQIILDDQIDKLFEDSPELNDIDKDKFEIAVAHFASFKYLHGIDSDDLITGIMGSGGDEGIDMCYIFCNGILVRDEKVPLNSESTIKVKFFQAKKVNSFSVNGFKNTVEGINEIFDLSLQIEDLEKIGANQSIIEKAELIRKLYRKSQKERASFSCEVYYVTQSPTLDIPAKITELYEPSLKNNILSIPYKFEYWGCQKLLDLDKKFDEELEVAFDLQPLNISEKEILTSGFAGFVRGNDLMKSLIDENNEFKSHLTEGNVRHFMGVDKKINTSIISTANDEGKANIFWAMNNGITILGEDIKPLGSNIYNVINPQIVNGCQTIHCLHHAYSRDKKNVLPNSLKVFVKLIKTKDSIAQTDIISATNSQNPVKSASLKANDNIQRNIETYLGKYAIYYERRDNFYKRQGYKGNKVVGLLKMAQIIHTIVNKESIVATNDPATLFDTIAKYNSIFNIKADFEIYAFSVRLFQIVIKLKNADLRKNKKTYTGTDYDLISKGGFVLLHIISSLLFSKADIVDKNGKIYTRPHFDSFSIAMPPRKNEFTLRKKWLFDLIEEEGDVEEYFTLAKDIFFSTAVDYAAKTKKSQISLLKNRHFDKDYLRPAIKSYVNGKS